MRLVVRRFGLLIALLAVAAPAGPAWAHAGQPPEPHDLGSAWNLDAGLWLLLGLSAWAYARGRSGWQSAGGRWRAAFFAAGLAALAAALVSPLDALGTALFSAHMAQHLLLVVVAAPLLALSAPLAPVLRALPARARHALGRWWQQAFLLRAAWHAASRPPLAWALHTLAMWAWHAPGLYQAALHDEGLHALEHASFFGTGLLFWWAVTRPARGQGQAVLYIFGMALQGGALGALVTLAPSPWYPAYAATTAAWGLTPLEDQQLAGVLMWVLAGLAYVIAALGLFAAWLAAVERSAESWQALWPSPGSPAPSGPGRNSRLSEEAG